MSIVSFDSERLEPELRTMLDAVAALGLPPLPSTPVAVSRERVRGSAVQVRPGPTLPQVRDAVVALDDHEVRVRRYIPENPIADALVVHLHGGGWVLGDLDYGDAFCRLIAHESGAPVVNVDYRLAPEVPFPGPLEDLLGVVRWERKMAPDSRVLLVGDSAGGNLAVAAALALAGTEAQVDGLVLLYPVLDSDMSTSTYARYAEGYLLTADAMAWFWEQYVPEPGDRQHELVSPAHSTDLGRLPRTHISIAGHDPLQGEGLAFADALVEAGVAVSTDFWPSLVHGFTRLTAVSECADRATRRAARSVATVLDDARTPRHATTTDPPHGRTIMTTDLDTRVTALEDLAAIRALKARYCKLADLQDWEGLSRCFVNDLAYDTGMTAIEALDGGVGPNVPPNAGIEGVGADALVDLLKGRLKGARSVHHIHEPEIELTSPTTAKASWPIYDLVLRPGGAGIASWLGHGYYNEEYIKVDGEWLIARLQVVRLRMDQRQAD